MSSSLLTLSAAENLTGDASSNWQLNAVSTSALSENGQVISASDRPHLSAKPLPYSPEQAQKFLALQADTDSLLFQMQLLKQQRLAASAQQPIGHRALSAADR